MLKFSEKTQGFYDTDFNYTELPEDLVDVKDQAQHFQLLEKIRNGCQVFSDLTCSDPKPSRYHIWSPNGWVDTDTPEAKQERYMLTLKPLTRRQFMLTLVHYDLDETIVAKIDGIEDPVTRKVTKIEYAESTTFIRTDPTVISLAKVLDLTDDKLNEMWEFGMLL